MARRKTLPAGPDPVSVVLGSSETNSSGNRSERENGQRAPKKERVAFYLSSELANEIRNAVVALSGPPHRMTMTSLAEMAFQQVVEGLQSAHNKGEPFPQREEDLKGGRPIL